MRMKYYGIVFLISNALTSVSPVDAASDAVVQKSACIGAAYGVISGLFNLQDYARESLVRGALYMGGQVLSSGLTGAAIATIGFKVHDSMGSTILKSATAGALIGLVHGIIDTCRVACFSTPLAKQLGARIVAEHVLINTLLLVAVISVCKLHISGAFKCLLPTVY